jgi:hypothetical protein
VFGVWCLGLLRGDFNRVTQSVMKWTYRVDLYVDKLFGKKLSSLPNTKHQTPNTKHQTPNTKHQTPPNTKHQTPNTKHQTPNTN